MRVGPQVFIYGGRGTYPGWDKALKREPESAANYLFEVGNNLEITRLSFCYVNALRSDRHGINGVNDLDLGISIVGKPVKENLNFNFVTRAGPDSEKMTRVAIVDRFSGQIPENTIVILDIDVYTGNSFRANRADQLKEWVINAHKIEKESFFGILGSEAKQRLKADK